MDDPFDLEVRRLANVLSTIVRVEGRTRQSLERELGLSSGYLSKILGGAVDLRVRHLLAIAAAIGIDAANFFTLAYPPHAPRTDEERRVMANAQAALGQRPAGEEPSAEFDQRVKGSLIRLLGLGATEKDPE